MTPHERHQHNQRAFAAMHTRLQELENTRTVYCDTPQQYTDIKSQFQQLNIHYDEITCRQLTGKNVPGFRISTEAFIFLSTFALVNIN